ncbi:DUF4142 domain-containing protein [Prosthecomicrobium sp. N25]|uniref:DUF4142 domain-containing protein n=1 Tax=Prosthecomicrobium sp. N25 TaxID=3129254 RepID=UPI0030787A93
MKLATALAVAAALALPGALALPQAALAQGANGTNSRTTAGASSAAAQKMDAATFVRMAHSSNMLEIESSRMALQQSKRDDIKAFAQTMVDDHTSAGTKMQQAVAASRAAQATSAGGAGTMDPKHQAMLKQLTQAQNANFDRAYATLQRSAHQEAVTLFTNYAERGDDQNLVAFAKEMLPALEKHLEAANALGGR